MYIGFLDRKETIRIQPKSWDVAFNSELRKSKTGEYWYYAYEPTVKFRIIEAVGEIEVTYTTINRRIEKGLKTMDSIIKKAA